DPLGIVAAPATLDVTEGQTAPLTVHLTAQPPGPVTVTVVSSNATAVGVTPTTLAFDTTTWAVDRTVIVDGLQDLDTAPAASTITFAGPGLADVAVAVSVNDD